MLAHRLLIAQVVKLFHQTMEEGFVGGAPHQLNLNRTQCSERHGQRRSVDQDCFRPWPRRPPLTDYAPAHGRQLDLAGSLQHQQQTPAHHVAQRPVGLFPVQGLAQLPRQFPTAAVGMTPDELSQESDLLPIDGLPAVSPRFRFRHNCSMPEIKAERKPFVVGYFNLLFATPARLLSPDCPPPTATALGAPAISAPVRRPKATT